MCLLPSWAQTRTRGPSSRCSPPDALLEGARGCGPSLSTGVLSPALHFHFAAREARCSGTPAEPGEQPSPAGRARGQTPAPPLALAPAPAPGRPCARRRSRSRVPCACRTWTPGSDRPVLTRLPVASGRLSLGGTPSGGVTARCAHRVPAGPRLSSQPELVIRAPLAHKIWGWGMGRGS